MINAEDQTPCLAGVVILAGGASTRMGTPKAKLCLPSGETLLDYHVRQAAELNVPVMIADNERDFKVSSALLLNSISSPISYIVDYASTVNGKENHPEKATGGALVAIVSALQAVAKRVDASILGNKHKAWLLVISCDSLIPAKQLWQKLQPYIAQATEQSVICLTDHTHLYPLLGLYSLSLEADLRTYLDNGERQVMKFIQPQLQTVPLPNSWQQLTNFNTPEHFKQACIALTNL